MITNVSKTSTLNVAHATGHDTITLRGGPYHLKIFVGDNREDWARFPSVEELVYPDGINLMGEPSACAPRATNDGRIVYANSQQRNMFGSVIFDFVGELKW